ncbi:hypothetical protein C9374_012149 [Naegleria lovaniensis]|uniref:BTB domain-containing protein n=1 Tax=Naegleria lovaniensis TaxID=51637 RepID=A0AA88G7W9_NAELO|nr:uncharacterized protein C9374_012149 [Naegleria lovaniensis]KAG2373410.1 hypothetical protein C9374_012149 [Naegleria lovaniensis]
MTTTTTPTSSLNSSVITSTSLMNNSSLNIQNSTTTTTTTNNRVGLSLNSSTPTSTTVSNPSLPTPSSSTNTRKFSLNRDVFINSSSNSYNHVSSTTTAHQPQASHSFSWNFADPDRRRSSSGSSGYGHSSESSPTTTTTTTTANNTNSILYLNLDEKIPQPTSSTAVTEHQQRPINHQRNRNKGSNGISEYSFTVDDLLQTSPTTLNSTSHPTHSHSNSFGSVGSSGSTITVVGVSNAASTPPYGCDTLLTDDVPLTEFINLDLTSILPHQKLLRFFLRNNQSYFTNASQMGKHSPVIAQEMSFQTNDLFGNLNVGGDYYSDITIRFIPSGREIHAHKFMLSMYSPVLAAMFNSQWKDSQQNVIEIVTELSGLNGNGSYEDIDDEQLFVEMILCMYSGQVYQIEPHLIVPLLEISDKYQFTELCRACEEYLRVHLNEHNCISLLYLSGGGGFIGNTTSTSPNTNVNNNNGSTVIVSGHLLNPPPTTATTTDTTCFNTEMTNHPCENIISNQVSTSGNNSTHSLLHHTSGNHLTTSTNQFTKKVNTIGKFERLRERALTYIDTHFEKVSKTKSFLFLDLETLIFLLGRGELRVDSEDVILDAILRWCEGDLEQRRDVLFTTLLEQVRLYHLSPNRLAHLGEVLEKFTKPINNSTSTMTDPSIALSLDSSSNNNSQQQQQLETMTFTRNSLIDPTIMNWMNRIIHAMSFQLSQTLGFQLSLKMQQKISIESPPRKRATQDITRISSLLSQEQFLQILEWINEQGKIGKDLSEREWLVLYRGSKDGFNGKAFHQKCDGKGPTFTVIKTDKGFMFGGFTCKSWHSGNTDESDENAFLFSLYNPYLNNKMTRFKIKSGMSAAIGCYSNFGVIFGGGRDLIIYADCNINNSSHCEFFGHTYQLPNLSGMYYGSLKSKTFFNGTEQFRVSDYEVFGLVPSKDTRKKSLQN